MKREKVFVNLGDLPPISGESNKKKVRSQLYQKRYQEQYRKVKKTVKMTVDEDEYIELKAASKAAGIPLSRYMYVHALASIKKSAALEGNMRKLLKELGRIGTNINQMAKKLNSERSVSLNDLTTLDDMRGDLKTIKELAFHASGEA